jgi:hypothetical protein
MVAELHDEGKTLGLAEEGVEIFAPGRLIVEGGGKLEEDGPEPSRVDKGEKRLAVLGQGIPPPPLIEKRQCGSALPRKAWS